MCMIQERPNKLVERLDSAVLVNKINLVADDALGVAVVVVGPAGLAFASGLSSSGSSRR